MKEARLIGSYAYRDLRYTKNHPLRIPRVSLLLEFLTAMGLLSEEELVESRPATVEELLLFHEEEYVRALMEADRTGRVSKGVRERFNIGNYENPVSPATFKGSALATGSSIQAAELFLRGFVAFNPAGGMHHAYENRANGFCFINDPVITIEYLRSKGIRQVLYIDLDAHHCDGVQRAYYSDDSVFVFSIHQSPEYAFPFRSGFMEERGEGRGKGYNLNIPLPKGINDSEFLYVLERSLMCLKEVFIPEIYVLQLGTDALAEDPLSRFSLSNRGFLEAFRIVRSVFGEGVYLGGGGYHPIALARAWTLLWCEMSGREIPPLVNEDGRKVLQEVDWEESEEETDRTYMYEKLIDPWRYGEVREEVKEIVSKVKATIYS